MYMNDNESLGAMLIVMLESKAEAMHSSLKEVIEWGEGVNVTYPINEDDQAFFSHMSEEAQKNMDSFNNFKRDINGT